MRSPAGVDGGPDGGPDRTETIAGSDADEEMVFLIRYFERAVLDLYAAGEIAGTTHTCLGQEHIPVAVSGLLRAGDHVFSNHRGHGHYLSRFGDVHGLLAEIMGRRGGVCNGVGGSQHIHRPGYLSTGVQGESLPVAAGVALHLKRTAPGALACVYIGDGTWGEGSVYEALNLAALWRLPLLVVVENNGIAQSTPTTAALAGSVRGRVEAFGLTHRLITGLDIPAIRAQLDLGGVRAGHPLVAEFVTHRLGPHSKGDDTRSPAELERILSRYPREGSDSRAERRARQRVADAVADVRARPPA